jgi:ADP-heptose:LPS heptosyltransferase
MSYESDPKKLHLKAYYEFCGIPESEQVIRNPKLNFAVDCNNTLFPNKYVVIHIDKRETPHRNIEGINWPQVIKALQEKEYTVFQIGKGESDDAGAIRMNTLAEPMMAYLISGATCVIGIDSGPMNVAVATGRKCIVFHGSVNPDYIYPDQTNIRVIQNHDKKVCDTPYCWHDIIGCEGKKCVIDAANPPCAIYDTNELLTAINELL